MTDDVICTCRVCGQPVRFSDEDRHTDDTLRIEGIDAEVHAECCDLPGCNPESAA